MEFFLAFFGLFSGFLMHDPAISGGLHRGSSAGTTPIGAGTTPIGAGTTPIG
jgi:hypothetical protein